MGPRIRPATPGSITNPSGNMCLVKLAAHDAVCLNLVGMLHMSCRRSLRWPNSRKCFSTDLPLGRLNMYVGRQDICCVCREDICCIHRQDIWCDSRQGTCGLPRHPLTIDNAGGRQSTGMSWETTDVSSGDTADVLSADATDFLSADTTAILSADTTGLASANTRYSTPGS